MWFMIIDSRSFTNTINVYNIETFEETKDERLNLIYFIPDPKLEDKFIKKQEIYDCCENPLILKTYKGIKKRIIDQMGSEDEF